MRHPMMVAALLAIPAWLPADAQAPPAAQLRNGQATFVQNGKEVTWILWQGTIRSVTDPLPANRLDCLFTPDGKPGPEEGGSLLRLSISGSRETYTLVALAVENGPGGPGLISYREPRAKCKLTIARFDETSIRGSIACTGEFDGGPPVTKLYLSAGP